MKTLNLILLSAAGALAPALLNAESAKADLLLRGVLDMGGEQTFSLSDFSGSGHEWLEIGQSFQGYELIAYDPETKELKLEPEDGATVKLSMAGSSQAGMAKAYSEVFTEEELKGMSNFYTTPAGRASLEKMPEVQAKSMEVMMPAIMSASQNLQQKLMKFIQEREAAKAE